MVGEKRKMKEGRKEDLVSIMPCFIRSRYHSECRGLWVNIGH